MDNLIQIVDENDIPTSAATKKEARKLGLRHRVVRIMLENDKGDLLLQHRSPTKDIFPNCWDNSAAGHVDQGEDYDDAANRELEEELGITKVKLSELGNYASNETWNRQILNRFNKVYRANINYTPDKLEEGNIDKVKWFTLQEVKNLVDNHESEVSDGLRQVFNLYYRK